ncbi:hypothetical protein PGT21_037090 [Puccinia graminis f. sp. tritici]|uniref:Uncharacterized protein n=1 Tax=Puccinia graminis f. sp. tritici TaxID=56615 RepID=A0A5B0R3G4_PUCGR|nr:hypothetical protein PGT21_037090 [Puccinia graminis f. sp. tritici]
MLSALIEGNKEPGVNSEADDGNKSDEEVDKIVPGTFEVAESEDDEEAEKSWMDFVGVAIGQIDSELAVDDPANDSPLFRREEEKIRKVTPEDSEWFPFLNKEYLIGSLLVRYLHKLISRDLYHQIRVIFMLNQIKLPRWEALRLMRAQIRTLVNQTIVEQETVFGQPVFGLKASNVIKHDLMNPLVAPHMDFFPEDAHGKNIYKLSQSTKWLKHLASDLRVQMCPNQLRTMNQTKENSKKLWAHAKETVNLEKLDKKSAELGVRDQINRNFSKQ